MTPMDKTNNLYSDNIRLMLTVWSVKMVIVMLIAIKRCHLLHISELWPFLLTKLLTLAK